VGFAPPGRILGEDEDGRREHRRVWRDRRAPEAYVGIPETSWCVASLFRLPGPKLMAFFIATILLEKLEQVLKA